MKSARHEKIIELIQQHDIDTQEELAARLNSAGFKVTQATVSRDIRALKLTKVAGKDGKSRYAVLSGASVELGDKYTRVLHDALTSIDVGQNMIVIRTVPGMAMGGCGSTGCTELERNPRKHCRGRYRYVCGTGQRTGTECS